MAQPPNILLVQADQLTIDVLGCYGNAIAKTPNLDAMANEGVVFQTAYCNYPLCSPSRASMASGRLASRIGAYDNATELPASVPTYAHYLRAAGYQTCLSGKMHFIGPDQLHGFETRLTSDVYPSDFAWTPDWQAKGFHGATDIRMLTTSGVSARNVQLDYDEDVSARAVQHIYDVARSDDDRPMFLHVSFTHPHDPYLCQPQHWDLYPDGIPMPITPRIPDDKNDPHSLRVMEYHGLREAKISDDLIRQARRGYCGSVSYIDDKLGQLMAALRQAGMAENTVVIFTSDHGEMLGERGLWLKKTMFEAAARVPMVIWAPGRIKAGLSEAMVSLVDLVPTLMALAGGGLAPVDPLDGDDMLALPREGKGTRPVVSELLCEGINAPIFMLREGDIKLIASEGDPPMMFDLAQDPQEQVNIATDPDYAETFATMMAQVDVMWDSDGLSADIVQSQQRRILINNALVQGARPAWDHPPESMDGRYYRGDGNYNDWAFSHLPVKR